MFVLELVTQLVKLIGCDTLSVSSYRLPHSQTILVVADLVEKFFFVNKVSCKNLGNGNLVS